MLLEYVVSVEVLGDLSSIDEKLDRHAGHTDLTQLLAFIRIISISILE